MRTAGPRPGSRSRGREPSAEGMGRLPGLLSLGRGRISPGLSRIVERYQFIPSAVGWMPSCLGRFHGKRLISFGIACGEEERI